MKKVILALSLLATTSVISLAQNKTTSAPAPAVQQPLIGREQLQETAKVTAQKEVDRLEKPLQLTDNQKQAVYGITMKWSMVGQQGNMSKQKVQEMKEDQLKHALTPEQYAKYKTMNSTK